MLDQARLYDIKQASQNALESAKEILDGDNFTVEGFDTDPEAMSSWVIYIGYNGKPLRPDAAPTPLISMHPFGRKYAKVFIDSGYQVSKIFPIELDQ